MATIWGADQLVENEKEYIKALRIASKICKQTNKRMQKNLQGKILQSNASFINRKQF